MPDDKTIRSAWRGTNAFAAWSYRGHEGEQAFVEVYSLKGETAELMINGVSKEKKKLEQYKASFETLYEAGTVKVIVYDKYGDIVGEDSLTSASGTVKICIEPETEAIQGKILYVNINLCGENGIIERACDQRLSIEVTGGKLLGYGSANPRTEENFLTGTYTTYYGRSLAVILVEDGAQLGITVKGDDNTISRRIEVNPPQH